MQPLGDFLKDKFTSPTKKGPNSERADLVGQFLNRLNAERVGTKYKPITPGRLGMILAHLSVSDLYYFLSICKDSGSFSKTFFGRLKVQRKNNDSIKGPSDKS